MCKKLEFNYATKCYMHRPESLLENETQKIRGYFEIQTDNRIPTRKPGPVLINKKEIKKNCYWIDFIVPADYRENSSET